jgi:hypothetical protein
MHAKPLPRSSLAQIVAGGLRLWVSLSAYGQGRLMDSTQCRATRSGGIRVVVCDPEEQVRAALQEMISVDSVLVLASAICSWQECEADLDSLLPELLIVRSDLLPVGCSARFEQDTGFPVLLVVRPPSNRGPTAVNSADLQLPLNPETARRSLDHAVVQIYNRKAKQLSALVSHYIAGLAELRAYRSAVTVERDGKSWDVSTRSILAIMAARKSVCIDSLSGRFILRKPIYQVATDLDPSMFVRISRSIIINRYFLDCRATLADKVCHAVLMDGSKHVVGLDYRDSITRILRPDLVHGSGTRC